MKNYEIFISFLTKIMYLSHSPYETIVLSNLDSRS